MLRLLLSLNLFLCIVTTDMVKNKFLSMLSKSVCYLKNRAQNVKFLVLFGHDIQIKIVCNLFLLFPKMMINAYQNNKEFIVRSYNVSPYSRLARAAIVYRAHKKYELSPVPFSSQTNFVAARTNNCIRNCSSREVPESTCRKCAFAGHREKETAKKQLWEGRKED